MKSDLSLTDIFKSDRQKTADGQLQQPLQLLHTVFPGFLSFIILRTAKQTAAKIIRLTAIVPALLPIHVIIAVRLLHYQQAFFRPENSAEAGTPHSLPQSRLRMFLIISVMISTLLNGVIR